MYVKNVVNGIRQKFPAMVDMSKIRERTQQSGENVTEYFHQLISVCEVHSGHPRPAEGWGLFESVLKAQFVDGPQPEYKDQRVGARTELKPLHTEHASHAGSGGHLQLPHNDECELPEAANNNEETPELGHVIAMWVIEH